MRSTQSSTRPPRPPTARPSCSRGSRTAEESLTSRSRAPRTASTAGRSSPSPCWHPATRPSEQWGFEDPRVVWVDELGRWVITCTAYGPAGPAVFLATTEHFDTVERYGIVRQPEDKNAALLPLPSRRTLDTPPPPQDRYGGARGEILLSRSDDLVNWSAPEQVLQPRAGAWWDSLRIGIGPPPLRTEHGWLLLYHGVKDTVGGDIYRVGLALLDLNEPTRVLRRLPNWIFAPLAPYERTGDVPNVVFPCGLVHDSGSDEVRLYYGAADSSICVATARLHDLVEAVLTAPREGEES